MSDIKDANAQQNSVVYSFKNQKKQKQDMQHMINQIPFPQHDDVTNSSHTNTPQNQNQFQYSLQQQSNLYQKLDEASGTPRKSQIADWNKQHISPSYKNNIFPQVLAPSMDFSMDNSKSLKSLNLFLSNFNLQKDKDNTLVENYYDENDEQNLSHSSKVSLVTKLSLIVKPENSDDNFIDKKGKELNQLKQKMQGLEETNVILLQQNQKSNNLNEKQLKKSKHKIDQLIHTIELRDLKIQQMSKQINIFIEKEKQVKIIVQNELAELYNNIQKQADNITSKEQQIKTIEGKNQELKKQNKMDQEKNLKQFQLLNNQIKQITKEKNQIQQNIQKQFDFKTYQQNIEQLQLIIEQQQIQYQSESQQKDYENQQLNEKQQELINEHTLRLQDVNNQIEIKQIEIYEQKDKILELEQIVSELRDKLKKNILDQDQKNNFRIEQYEVQIAQLKENIKKLTTESRTATEIEQKKFIQNLKKNEIQNKKNEIKTQKNNQKQSIQQRELTLQQLSAPENKESYAAQESQFVEYTRGNEYQKLYKEIQTHDTEFQQIKEIFTKNMKEMSVRLNSLENDKILLQSENQLKNKQIFDLNEKFQQKYLNTVQSTNLLSEKSEDNFYPGFKSPQRISTKAYNVPVSPYMETHITQFSAKGYNVPVSPHNEKLSFIDEFQPEMLSNEETIIFLVKIIRRVTLSLEMTHQLIQQQDFIQLMNNIQQNIMEQQNQIKDLKGSGISMSMLNSRNKNNLKIYQLN